ncbi:MAG: hypothetical protein AAF771_09410 [Pseudomonadota bacterium]
MDWAQQTLPPLILMGTLAVILPRFFMRYVGLSLAALAQWLVITAGLLVVVGAALFALVYLRAGLDLAALAGRPLAAAWHFVGLGFSTALIWLPLLLLTGLQLAMRVERLKGEAIAARDKG